MIQIGLIQAPSLPCAEENLAAVRRFAGEAADRGCAAVCFPEAFLTGYVPEEASSLGLDADGPLLRRVSFLADELGIDLLVGFMERSGSGCHLTHGIFRPDGSRDFYRKTHLGQKEQRCFVPGGQLDIFSLSCGLRVGFQMCVEVHFPDITRTLALRGAQVIFAPHAIPRAAGDRAQFWNKIIPARSYDNRVYMACCNQWDPQRFGGGCLVTDPRGDVTAACFADGPQLLTAEVDPEMADRYRNGPRYYPGQRRPELYI